MNIKIKRHFDSGMTDKFAHRLDIHAAFDTARGKSMTKRMEIIFRNTRSRQRAFIEIFIAARLYVSLASRQKI